jgi:hypothetical protein
MYECKTCKKFLPIEKYRLRKDRSNYRVKDCRKCEKKIQRKISDLKRSAPLMPKNCDCCGEDRGESLLQLDHCHEEGNFRGWLCNKCNTGIGALGDTTGGLQKAIEYLRKSNASI